VAVDVRLGSPTFGQYADIVLNAENHQQFYVPEGFAHGFCTLTEDIEVTYMVSNFYTPGKEAGIKWNDPEIGIDVWPTDNPILSEKDANWPAFEL
jgi:dTDP-4-dehydrorhamnose 3,5-epimerase